MESIKQDKSKAHKEFETLVAQDLKNRSFREGTIVTGTVEDISKKWIWIDLGLKSSGAVPIEEFKLHSKDMNIAIGDKCEVLLERLENRSGDIVVSREKARRAKSWTKMEKAFENNQEVTGSIVQRCKGGYIANIDSCLCFLPSSQVSIGPPRNMEGIMKTPQVFAIVKLDRVRGNIVVSRRAVLEKIRNKDKSKLIEKIKEGDIVTGIVKNLTDWGCFLDINGLDALLHITDISWSRINKPSELLSLSQSVKVVITKIDSEKMKISCSIKNLTEDPYSKIINKYEIGKQYPAIVTKVQDYGCFAKLEDGLEGLIHQSELSWVKKNIHPGKILSTSQKIMVQLLEKDSTKRRLSLSFKRTIPNPWDNFVKKFKVGDEHDGVVKNITDFGLFVTIKDTELDGLIHYKDLDFSEKETELEKYKKNMSVKFKILEINREAEKIRLGVKQRFSDPFLDAFAERNLHDTITVVVSGLSQNGIYVNVGKKNFSVLIKKNQLAVEIENQRISRFVKGDRLDVLITELLKDKRKVSLSIKALEEKILSENVKKWGKEKAGTGAVLGDILGPILNKKKKK